MSDDRPTIGPHAGRARAWPLPLVTVLLALSYGGLYLSVTLVTSFGGSSGTTFWPSAGVTLAVLLRRRRRDWPVLLAGVWVMEFALDLIVSEVPVAVASGWATANTVEPLLAASLLTLGGRGVDLARRSDLLRFVAFGVFAGPALGALVGTGSGAAASFYALWPASPRWFAGDAIGVLVVAPMVLLAGRALLNRERIAVAIGVPFGLAVAALLVTAPWRVPWDDALPFLLIPMLIVAALRLSAPVIALAVGLVAFAINFMTAAGYGPFALHDGVAGLMEAQAFLAATTFTALLVAALTSDLVTAGEADEAKNTLLQTVAHDLRGPLAAVGGLAETLQAHDDLPHADRTEILVRIRRTSHRLISMVERILDFERLKTGPVEPQREPTDVGANVRELAAICMAVSKHPITVDAPPILADVDPDEVDRIVENLLSNAARHTPEGTPVRASVQVVPRGIEIAVEDEGPGIDDDLKHELFEPFASGRSARPGAGLGLALVARLAERHGGRAWVEDRPGGGASFRVFLEAEVSDGAAASSAEVPARWKTLDEAPADQTTADPSDLFEAFREQRIER